MDQPEHNLHEIQVNGVVIPEASIASEMQYHPADSRHKAFNLAARALVVKELLLQQAARKKITNTEEASDSETGDEARVRLLIEKEVEIPSADEKTCRTYYEANRSRFRTSPLIEVSHILIATSPEDLEGRRAAREKADNLLEQLDKDPDLFENLAKHFSACPSRDTGGSLGQISKGQTTKEFQRQIFSLPKGLSERPIETHYGYHIVRVDQRVDGKELNFEQVKKNI